MFGPPRKTRLLVIAADADFRDVSSAVAENLGFEIYSTSYATDFFQRVANFEPSVLILDIEFLGKKPNGLLNFLASQEPPPRVVLLCGDDNRYCASMVKHAAPRLGLNVVGVLEQPMEMEKLARVLRPLLAI